MKLLRIALVSATFPPYWGGTGNVCYYNARELARRGHDVHVFTMDRGDALREEQVEGFNMHRLPPLVNVGNAALVPQLLWKLIGFDILHFHYPFHGGEGVGLAAWLTHTPLIITYHQDVILSGWRGWIDLFLRYTVGKAMFRSAQRFLFTSMDYGQASHISPLLKGRENLIAEQSNGVDTNLFCPGPAVPALREIWGVGEQDRLAVLVAGLDISHYFKGVPVFLKALSRLPVWTKGCVIGDGDMRFEYEAQAKRLGLGERVFFPGRVSDSELADYYRLADVVVLPSVTMGEAFGLVLIEAMACGKPVIASRLPGVRTVVSDGEDGFLIEPNNPIDLAEKLRMILSLPETERLAMGDQGRIKVIGRYSWEKVVAHLDAIYQDIILK